MKSKKHIWVFLLIGGGGVLALAPKIEPENIICFSPLPYSFSSSPISINNNTPSSQKIDIDSTTSSMRATSLPAPPFGIKTVVIDAGHGGKDPGCIGTFAKEKEVTLAIALKLGKYITQHIKDVKVIYTRKTDIFLELHERADIANRNKADLFISIHCNASEKKDVYGAETYVMGLHKTTANLNVAKRENASILLEKNYQKRYDGFDPNSETGYILLTLQQNAFLKQSLHFAGKVQKYLREKAGRLDKGVQQAGFLVLWRTAMPSVLIETDFLTNLQQEKFLSSEEGQNKIAWAVFLAFREYKDEIEGRITKYEDLSEKPPFSMPEREAIKQESSLKQADEPKHIREPIVEQEEAYVVKRDTTVSQQIFTLGANTNASKHQGSPLEISNKDTLLNIKPQIGVGEYIPVNHDTSRSNSLSVVYKVQFLSSSERIPLLSEKFRGLREVSEYEEGGLYKYTSGEFATLTEALKHREEMQRLGFKDCFVVKFKDGKRIRN